MFAERVIKNLRKEGISIGYDNYTYGKLIVTWVQEGLSLYNEIKLNQQIKKHSLNERKQLGQFCSQFRVGNIPENKLKNKRPQKIMNPHKFEKRREKEKKEKQKENMKTWKISPIHISLFVENVEKHVTKQKLAE